MVVKFSKHFMKELKKRCGKIQAKEIILSLAKTKPTDGDFISIVKDVMIRERKLKSFRFYFVQNNQNIEILTIDEIKDRILKFVAISKKNNQQDVINRLKEDLLKVGFKF